MPSLSLVFPPLDANGEILNNNSWMDESQGLAQGPVSQLQLPLDPVVSCLYFGLGPESQKGCQHLTIPNVYHNWDRAGVCDNLLGQITSLGSLLRIPPLIRQVNAYCADPFLTWGYRRHEPMLTAVWIMVW